MKPKQRQKQNGPNLHKLYGKQNSSLSYLKNSDLKISFKADNTLGKLLTHNKNTNFNKYNKCGVYQLACWDYNKKYIGQTGRSFHTRFQEHFRDVEYKNGKSKFAHLIDNGHSIAPMEDIMEILHVTKKGNKMDTLEKFHICNVTRLDNQINDKGTVKCNVIFDALIQNNSYRGHSPQ